MYLVEFSQRYSFQSDATWADCECRPMCEQLDRVNKSLIEWPAIVNGKGVTLQHDNKRPHSHCAWEVLPHTLYSPDDADLFRSLQHFLSGKRFANSNDIQNAVSIYFAHKPIDFYRFSIENLHIR